MRRLLLLIGCSLLVAGCGTQPATQGTKIPDPIEGNAAMSARIHTELGAGYYMRGQLGVALKELQIAVKAEPRYGPAYNVLGLVYSELGEKAAAEENFKRALEINPEDSDAQNNYGLFLCREKRQEEAIPHFLLALKNPLYKTPDLSYVNAAICSREMGDMKKAEEYFSRALGLQPNNAQALAGLARIADEQGQVDQAHVYLTRFMQVGQPDAETLLLGIKIERQRGDRQAEASYRSQLRNRFPKSKEAQAAESGQF
jgi:type IV pilus assembly protein PilF